MNEAEGYKKQQRLSFVQFLAEVPNFAVLLVSVIISRSVLVLVDMLDSLGDLLRAATVTLLSKKLTRDLRFVYNYGIGKIEAIAALLCDGTVFFGLTIALGLSIHGILFPNKPSDFLIAVVALKVINVSFDSYFFIKQRKLLKHHRTAISKSNYAAAIFALLFDSMTLVSLLTVWLLRNNPIGHYITPVFSSVIAIYLMVQCIRRIKAALDEITDKTLPEEVQLKILSVMSKLHERYSRFYSIRSHRNGSVILVDFYIAFDDDVTFASIIKFKEDAQELMDRTVKGTIVNIVVQDPTVSR